MAEFPNKDTQFKPGESGNPNGRMPGSRNLATIVKNILEDGELDWDKLPIKNAQELKKRFGNRGWDALVYVATAQALSGDMKAVEWLRKAQYGNRLTLEAPVDEFAQERADMSVIFGILRRPTANEPNSGPDTPTEA